MRVDDDSAMPPVDPPTYPGQSGEGAQVGELHSRVRRLEAVPASTATVTRFYSPIGYTAVQGVRETPKKWPGAMRAVPAYGWNVAGTEVSAVGYAYREVRHNQTAATFAAAADTLTATVENWLLTPGVRYQCHVGFSVSGGETTAKIGIESASIGTSEIGLTGAALTHGNLWRIFSDKTFAAGETITVKLYRTSGAGDMQIDQLYFFPTNVTSPPNNTGPSGNMVINIPVIQISAFADLGPSATVANDDALSGNAVIDAQVGNDLKDIEFSAADFLVAPIGGKTIQDSEQFFDEEMIGRHNYVTARYHSTTDSWGKEGIFITSFEDGIPKTSCRVFAPSAGIYYLGISNPYFAPPQLYLWRNNCGPSPTIPYAGCPPANVQDCRIGQFFSISSWVDDYFLDAP